MLKQPIKVGNTELKNRLVMAPVALYKSDNGTVNQQLLDYYNERTAGGYIGLVVVEHSYVSFEGKASPNQLSAAEDADIEGLKKLADLIHKNGSNVILQISHAGSAARENVTHQDAISCSVVVNPGAIAKSTGGQRVPKEMSQGDIARVLDCFVAAAKRAKAAGFDGCEIHSAHGYLLNQFYSPLSNHRTDDYAGNTMDGRIHLHLQIIKAVRTAVGQDFIISMRFGACDYMDGGSTQEEAAAAALEFEKAGLDLLDVSGGFCFFTRPGHTEQGWFADLTESIKKHVNIPVVLTGGIVDANAAENLLNSGKADMVGVGRAIMKDAAWAQKEMM